MINPPNNTIIQYVYNKPKPEIIGGIEWPDANGKPTIIGGVMKHQPGRRRIGVVVATKRADNTVGFGYSLCATNRGDKFNSETALNIALGRAEHFPHFECKDIPQTVQKVWSEMYHRSVRYFKGAEIG